MQNSVSQEVSDMIFSYFMVINIENQGKENAGNTKKIFWYRALPGAKCNLPFQYKMGIADIIDAWRGALYALQRNTAHVAGYIAKSIELDIKDIGNWRVDKA